MDNFEKSLVYNHGDARLSAAATVKARGSEGVARQSRTAEEEAKWKAQIDAMSGLREERYQRRGGEDGN